MARHETPFKHILAAFVAVIWFSMPVGAQNGPPDGTQGGRLADLYARLTAAPDPVTADQIEAEIVTEWSKSGSPAIDLLLRRGEDALEEGEFIVAAEHFTAAIDHDPGFAEAYHSRAAAYYRAGLVGAALDDLGRALVLDPQHFAAMNGIAVILEELDRPEQALAAYRQVQAIHPQDADVAGAIVRLETALNGVTL
jgi:Tfp pilus assembly protein PilF